MKPVTMIGAVLVILGIVGLALGGISWTETESVAQIGGLQITNEEENSFAIPPLASAIALGVGLVMVVIGVGRKS